ncbi:MAG: glycosyltransferase [Longimicrobiales bacterium]|nr:glycosyltransferase [Longimicrobiales bacterium]
MTPRPLRIAAHNGALTYGGGEKWIVLLLQGLQARGHTAHLFCNGPEVAGRAKAEGVSASLGVLGGHAMLPHAWRFSRQLRRFRPDALLLSTFRKAWLGGMAGRWAGVPRVVSRIGLDTDLPGKHWTYRLAFCRWVDAVVVNADGIRRDALSGLPGYPEERLATVYDGVRLRGPVPLCDEARASLGLPAELPLVGAVARLTAQKRLDRLLDALALLPGAHVALAGEGEAEGALRARAQELGLEGRVHFLGYREDVQTVLGALDVFVVTSEREGMANAMLEAMAAGVPVVSTPVSGAAEALAPDREGRAPGLIVEPDARALAEALGGLLDVRAARLAMGAEGRRRAAARFGYEAMLDAWEGVLGGDAPARWHRGG